MKLQDRLEQYLEYCIYRKELDSKTVKAYRIDLNQFFSFVCCDVPEKETIERYITELHKKYKQKTVKRKIASVKAFYSYLEEEEYTAFTRLAYISSAMHKSKQSSNIPNGRRFLKR